MHDVSRKYLASGRFGFTRETAISDDEMQDIAAKSPFSEQDAILLKNLAVDHVNEILNRIPTSDRAIAILLVKGVSISSIAHSIRKNPDYILEAIERIKSKLAGGGNPDVPHAAFCMTEP